MTRSRLHAALFFLIFLSCLLAGKGGLAQAKRPSFSLSVAPKNIALGESVTVTVKIEMPGLVGPDRYWHPQAASFRQVDSQVKRGVQTSIDSKRGQLLTTTWVYRYVLEPLESGRFSVGPAKIRVAGEDWETRERFVKVRASGYAGTKTVALGHASARVLAAPGYLPPQGPQEDVFLYAVCDKKRAWVGEQFVVSWLLFARAEVLKYEPTPPRLVNLWSETLFEPTSFFKYSDARVGGKDYVVALVSKRALFATASGELRVDPLVAKIATLSTAAGSGERISSNPIILAIRPLPKPAPAGFDPTYVGEFRIQASVDRDILPAGEALTLSVLVSGEGAMKRTAAPSLSFPGFSFEKPRDFEDRDTTVADRVSGERLYRYWTTPSIGGAQSIPVISLPYFSPKKGSYVIAKSRPVGISVQGDPKAQEEARKRSLRSRIDRDIRLLHATGEVESKVLVGLYKTRVFLFLLLLPIFAFVVTVLVSNLRKRVNPDAPRARLRRARAQASEHFREAETHLRGEHSSKFFGALSLAVYGHLESFLGDRRLRSMTREQLRELLRANGVEKSTIRRLLDEMETFDRERFAPSSVSPEEMQSAIKNVKSLLAAIESEPRDLAEPPVGESR